MINSPAARVGRSLLRIIVRVRLLGVVCAIAPFLTGCAGTPKYVRWYDGPALEANKVAIVKIHQDTWHAAMVDDIDGASIRKGKGPQIYNTETIELLPGKHQLAVSYIDTNGHSLSHVILNFSSEEGHVYELDAAAEERNSAQVVGAMIFGGKYYWSAWIIDSGSKEVVAGEKLGKLPHYYEDGQSPKGAASNLRP